MLVALSAIAADQAAPTELTLEKTLYFLDYVVSHPDAILTYEKSSMALAGHSDVSYFTEPKAKSRAGRHFYMSDDSEVPSNNEAVRNMAHMKNVIPSAADAEFGALYANSRQAIPAYYLSMSIQTNNTTALGFVTNNLQPKSINPLSQTTGS